MLHSRCWELKTFSAAVEIPWFKSKPQVNKNVLHDLMVQGLARQAEDREAPGSSPTQD